MSELVRCTQPGGSAGVAGGLGTGGDRCVGASGGGAVLHSPAVEEGGPRRLGSEAEFAGWGSDGGDRVPPGR